MTDQPVVLDQPPVAPPVEQPAAPPAEPIEPLAAQFDAWIELLPDAPQMVPLAIRRADSLGRSARTALPASHISELPMAAS